MDPTALHCRDDIRAMCAADTCRAYEKNWTCPPHCGTVEMCESRIRAPSHGILLQTVGHLQKTIDTRTYRATEERHRYLYRLRPLFSERWGKTLTAQ